MTRHCFSIAHLPFEIEFQSSNDGLELISSFIPFIVNKIPSEAETLFCLSVKSELKRRDNYTLIREIDTGNGITKVESDTKGNYQFTIHDVHEDECCLLQASSDFRHCHCTLRSTDNKRTFGLNNALMLAFAFAGSHHGVVLMHASLVRKDGWGYAFTAKSGTGKSTHVNLWLQNIDGCDLMNDDNPIVRIINGEAFIFGSPWSGKTPCYRNIQARLGAVTQICRDKENHVEVASALDAFTTLLTACSTMKWDHCIYQNICRTISKIVETTPNYKLFCRPDKEAAEICHKRISREQL